MYIGDGKITGSNIVPVFFVKKSFNQLVTSRNSSEKIAFSIFNFVTKIDHGYFHLPIGTFIVQTAGLFHLVKL